MTGEPAALSVNGEKVADVVGVDIARGRPVRGPAYVLDPGEEPPISVMGADLDYVRDVHRAMDVNGGDTK